MDIDTESYPLDDITSYDENLGCNPPKKKWKENFTIKNEAYMRSLPKKDENEVRSYRKHGDSVKEQQFFLLYKKVVDPGQAAKQLRVNRRTVYNWINGEKVGRPAFLNEMHKNHLIGFYDDSPSALLDQAMSWLHPRQVSICMLWDIAYDLQFFLFPWLSGLWIQVLCRMHLWACSYFL